MGLILLIVSYSTLRAAYPLSQEVDWGGAKHLPRGFLSSMLAVGY